MVPANYIPFSISKRGGMGDGGIRERSGSSLINPRFGKLFAFQGYFLFHSGDALNSLLHPYLLLHFCSPPSYVAGNPISRHQRRYCVKFAREGRERLSPEGKRSALGIHPH